MSSNAVISSPQFFHGDGMTAVERAMESQFQQQLDTVMLAEEGMAVKSQKPKVGLLRRIGQSLFAADKPRFDPAFIGELTETETFVNAVESPAVRDVETVPAHYDLECQAVILKLAEVRDYVQYVNKYEGVDAGAIEDLFIRACKRLDHMGLKEHIEHLLKKPWNGEFEKKLINAGFPYQAASGGQLNITTVQYILFTKE